MLSHVILRTTLRDKYYYSFPLSRKWLQIHPSCPASEWWDLNSLSDFKTHAAHCWTTYSAPAQPQAGTDARKRHCCFSLIPDACPSTVGFCFHPNHQSQWDSHGAGPDCPCAAAAACSPWAPPCQPLSHTCASPVPENKPIWLRAGVPLIYLVPALRLHWWPGSSECFSLSWKANSKCWGEQVRKLENHTDIRENSMGSCLWWKDYMA